MDSAGSGSKDIADDQYSGTRTVALHLLSGALVLGFYVAVAPVVTGPGFPSLMAICRSLGREPIPPCAPGARSGSRVARRIGVPRVAAASRPADLAGFVPKPDAPRRGPA